MSWIQSSSDLVEEENIVIVNFKVYRDEFTKHKFTIKHTIFEVVGQRFDGIRLFVE